MKTLMLGHQQALVTRILPTARLSMQNDFQYEQNVNELWARGLRNAKKTSTNLFDGPILRLHDVRNYGGKNRLRVDLTPTTYRHFFATSFLENAPKRTKRIWRHRVIPVGAQTYFLTKSGDIILFRRSSTLSIAPGVLRGLGGTSDFSLDCVKGQLDFQLTAFREASEELLLPLNEIGVQKRGFHLAGFVLNSRYWMATAVYWAKTNLTAHQAMTLPLDSEHTQAHVIPKRRLPQLARQVRRTDHSLSHYLSLIVQNIEERKRI